MTALAGRRDPPDEVAAPTLPPTADRARWAMLALLAIAYPTLLYLGRDQWFFLDEWAFLVERDGGSVDGFIAPHGDHPTMLPILVFRGIWQLVGMRSYFPYQLFVVAVHLGSMLVLRELMVRRSDINPWVASGVVVPLVFYGSGWQNLVWAIQITLVGSLLFGLIHLLLATRDNPTTRSDLTGLGFGLVGLMCSGVGVTMTVVVGIAVLLRRGWRAAALHTAPLGALYALWTLAYRDGQSNTTAQLSSKMGDFIWTGLADAFGSLGWYRFVGLAIVLVTVAGLAVFAGSGRASLHRAAVPLASAAGGLIFIGISAWGRAEAFGPDFARASRYSHLIVAAAIPAIGLGFDALVRRQRLAAIPLAVLLAVGLIPNFNEVEDRTRDNGRFQLGVEELFRAVALGVVEDPTIPDDVQPLPQHAPVVTAGWLRTVTADGDLEPRAAQGPNVAATDLRLSVQQVDVAPSAACEPLTEPVELSLEAGETFGISGGSIAVVAVAADSERPPRLIVSPAFGGTVRAHREIVVRLENGDFFGQVPSVCRE